MHWASDYGTMIARYKNNMKTRFRHIVLIITIAVITLAFPAVTVADDSAAEETATYETAVQDAQPGMDENETALFTLINAARRDPLGMAESLGMNRDEVLSSLPELCDILINGLPELCFNKALYRSAGAHNRDMLDQNYYAYASIDGKTPEQRMMEAGYVPAVAGEVLGMMFFNNFIDPNLAVSRIFENIFKDELSPERTAPRRILNPDFSDIGVSIGGGIYQMNNFTSNVYLGVFDFGASVKPHEIQLLALINQLRSKPGAVTRNFGIEVEEILDLFPEYTQFYSEGLPPLTFNGLLYTAADVQISDMLENSYWGHISPDGTTPLMRIRAQGYAPTWVAESKYRLSTCNRVISPTNTIHVIFKNMFLNAFKSGTYRDRNMLSEKAREAGFRIVATEWELIESLCGNQMHITLCDYGASNVFEGFNGENKIIPALTGVVYADGNDNGLYDAGEGAQNFAVKIESQETNEQIKIVFSGETGFYSAYLYPGKYEVSVSSTRTGKEINSQQVAVEVENTCNTWLPFLVNSIPSDF